jgi:hypothetical protein
MAVCRSCVLVVCLTLALPAAAQTADSIVDPLALQIHGFASQGFLVSTKNNYLAKSKQGSFELTEVGVNLTKPLTDSLRTGVQLFSRKLGATGNYNAKFDWFYIDYHWQDWLGFRIGRVKLPFGLYNEFNDIDSARVPILMPESIYPIQNRDFLLAQTGGELYGHIELSDAGALEYRLYGGTIFIDPTVTADTPYRIKSLDVPYVAGGRLLWETPLPGLRIGGSLQLLSIHTEVLYDAVIWRAQQQAGILPDDFTGKVRAKIPAVLWVGSIEYLVHDLLLAAEYSRWRVKVESSQATLFPASNTTNERLYGMAAYRVTTWFQPGLYYSLYFPNVDDRRGRDAMQHDLATTLRFDINDHWLVKLEGHYLSGTAELNPTLNDNRPRSNLTRNWTLFLVKTTGYF